MRGTQTLFSVPKHLITALLSYRDTGVLSGVGPCIYRRFVGWVVEIHGCREAGGGGALRACTKDSCACKKAGAFAHLLFHVYCAYASVISL